jgi:hypothetical protein
MVYCSSMSLTYSLLVDKVSVDGWWKGGWFWSEA